jgi:hypothetical protein
VARGDVLLSGSGRAVGGREQDRLRVGANPSHEQRHPEPGRRPRLRPGSGRLDAGLLHRPRRHRPRPGRRPRPTHHRDHHAPHPRRHLGKRTRTGSRTDRPSPPRDRPLATTGDPRPPLPVLLVAPTLVVEIAADSAFDHGHWRHLTRYVRARPDRPVSGTPAAHQLPRTPDKRRGLDRE